MEIKGKRTEISQVTVTVDPVTVLRELNQLVRKSLGIPQDVFIKIDKITKKPILYTTEYSYHNGDPYDVVVDKEPTEEVIKYLTVWSAMHTYVWEANE